jgi:hypothetical protein
MSSEPTAQAESAAAGGRAAVPGGRVRGQPRCEADLARRAGNLIGGLAQDDTAAAASGDRNAGEADPAQR